MYSQYVGNDFDVNEITPDYLHDCTGFDDVTSEHIIYAHPLLALHLSHLFSMVLQYCVVPEVNVLSRHWFTPIVLVRVVVSASTVFFLLKLRKLFPLINKSRNSIMLKMQQHFQHYRGVTFVYTSAVFVCYINNSKYAISLLSLLANKRIHMLQLDSGGSINFVMYQPCRKLLQMHIMNNTRFMREKETYQGKKSETNRGQGGHPTPTESTNGVIQSTAQLSCYTCRYTFDTRLKHP